jgi:NadR type nicotinamide-nucleotide adenylyltransferase
LNTSSPIKKIVIIGPESTGKSTLSRQLATHYKTLWTAEFAREYLLKNGSAYTYDDLLVIAKGQIQLEEAGLLNVAALSPNNPFLFIDTDMYVMKVWCEFVFNKCHQWILDQIAQRKYDLYLLCNTDIPWVKDALREYPDHETRQVLFNMYKDLLVNQQVPWRLISGNQEMRLYNAIGFINEQFTTGDPL